MNEELSASERFRQIFEEIITAEPKTIDKEKIEQLVGLIIDENSELYALTDQYIQGEQTRLTVGKYPRVVLLTNPEFIQSIWSHISRTLISNLDEDIRTIRLTLPDNYAELDARDKCYHVRTLFVKLDTIHSNLFPGVVSFISHTLQGLFGSFKDEVNRNGITAQTSEIEQLNRITSEIIRDIDNKTKSFACDFVLYRSTRRRNILPEMCFYTQCRKSDDLPHKLQFIHEHGQDDDCWFKSLQKIDPPRDRAHPICQGGRLNSNKQTNRTSRRRRTSTKRQTHTRRTTRRRR